MDTSLNVLSVFTGAGGLDLGLEAAGFFTRLCIETDPDALATLRLNRPQWAIAEPNDAIAFAEDPLAGLRRAHLKRSEIALLAGGPPCQPFSKASFWTARGPQRMEDPRASQTIKAYLRVVEVVRPQVLLFENVPAFAFDDRSEGFDALVRGLLRINKKFATKYLPQLIKVNAADYGVPQLRERIFVLAHRGGRSFEMPRPTHGPNSPSCKRHLTAWDAIGDLTVESADLRPQGRWAELLPSIPEGENYLWHTSRKGGRPLFGWRTRYWSFLLKLAKNQPSWTIPASPGPAIGPFHWNSRLLSVDELCRLQTFPNGYRICGNRRAAQRQIGNAVPSALAEFIGLEIRRQFFSDENVPSGASLLPAARRAIPAPEQCAKVPQQYLALLGNHQPHPGTGKGPGRRKKESAALHERA